MVPSAFYLSVLMSTNTHVLGFGGTHNLFSTNRMWHGDRSRFCDCIIKDCDFFTVSRLSLLLSWFTWLMEETAKQLSLHGNELEGLWPTVNEKLQSSAQWHLGTECCQQLLCELEIRAFSSWAIRWNHRLWPWLQLGDRLNGELRQATPGCLSHRNYDTTDKLF